ncbi:MAG TPA: beta-ketoacyl synthase N-terminal-like domain-containing protein, partial [Streptosporangiaceae bacterium]
MTGQLSDRDRARMERGGAAALTAAQGLALLDAAAGRDEPLLIPARLDLTGLVAAAGTVPALLQRLVRPGRPSAATGHPQAHGAEMLRRELAGLTTAEQDRVLLDLVRTQVARVLGHASAEAVEALGPGQAFTDLGFDSLTAVELRNQLHAATGLRLPATLIFDYPSPAVLTAFLRAGLTGDTAGTAAQPVASLPAGEPIAIVAMGCRLPGGVRSPEDLWELLADGRDAISGFPEDRGWDIDGVFDPDPDHAGTTYVRQGGFVSDAAAFDAGFFGISPREALGMDPQQRMLLEVCWEALERAGIDPGSLHGSPTGVFVGASPSGYGPGLKGLEGHLLTGTASSVLSGRVSYVLGLEGPAVTVDTACSSALVALHLGCAALRAGECDLALAGGVTVLATPAGFVGFSQQRGLAADGRCKSFSAAADGLGMAEGAGMVVLERLADARRRGHQVLAVVAGSAVNQDGASNGLTAPNGPSQQRVIRAALTSAGLSAGDIDAVEAHGTGTTLGDPIEVQALLATYGQDRDPSRPVWLGSVKSNIGHTQQTAGIAGVMKMVLALQHGVLPATLHAAEPSPHVDWSSGAVQLATQPVSWTANGRARRAGVSSFGFSGTNAHAILAEPPAGGNDGGTRATGPDPERAPGDGHLDGGAPLVLAGGAARCLAWVVSGRTAAGLAAQAGRLAQWVAARPGLAPGDVGWSLATTRSAFEHRAVVLGSDQAELTAGLAAVAAGEPAPGVAMGVVPAAGAGRVGFVFAGQGSQRAGMGAQLHACSPVFAQAFDRACALLEAELGVPVAEVVLGSGEDDRADQTVYAQAGLFAVEAGLVALLAACGVRPDAVAGHSVGEITAAYAAGVLTLEDACALVGARARLMQALPGGGAMTAVAATEAEVTQALEGVAGVSVAAVNGPSSVVVSGDAEAVGQVAGVFAGRGVRVRGLRVSHAFHSHRMDPVLGDLAGVAGGLAYAAPRVPWAGALTGELVSEPGAGYWARQAREPVRFADAVMALAAQGVSVFVEVGPDGTLSALGPAALGERDGVFVPVLRPGQPAAASVLGGLAELHARGVPVDWAQVLGPGRRVELPTYAFQRQRYWPQPAGAGAGDVTAAGLGAVAHPLLGAAVEMAAGAGYLLTGRLSLRSQPWLADHAVAGTVLLPGTAFVELAVQAGDPAGCGRLEELTLEAPLVLPAEGAVQVQVVVGDAGADGQRPVGVYARPEDAPAGAAWTRHASGLLAPADLPGTGQADEFAVWPPDGAVPADTSDLYDRLATGGYGYGPAFRGLRAAWRRGAEVFAEVTLPPDAAASAGSFGIHPALLDAALHAAGLSPDPADAGQADRGTGGVRLPFAWTRVSLHASGAAALRVRLTRAADGSWSLIGADAAGAPVVSVGSLALRPVAAGPPPEARDGGVPDAMFAVEWVPVASAGPASSRYAVVGEDRWQLAEALAAAELEVRGYPDLAALLAAAAGGERAPELVLVCAGDTASPGGTAASARAEVGRVLGVVQGWLADERLGEAGLVVVTRGAVAAGCGEGVGDLAGAAVWGLVRSARSEHPGRVVLADLPAGGVLGAAAGVLAGGLGSGEPELAVRDGVAYGRRLVRPSGGLARPAGGGAWRLEPGGGGTLDGLALVACPGAAAPLGAGQVRVAVRAAGLNFRDVLIGLGMYPGGGEIGGEVAGVVTETGPGVGGLVVGERVAGLASGGFGPVVVADARQLARVPAGWSFARAASVPVAFLTAWYALVDLAGVRAGQRLLVHAAAGGVGMAAVAIARHLGAEVYGTASPGKHGVLAGLGLDGAHVASSRDGGFEDAFLAATGGAGMDVVLNAL